MSVTTSAPPAQVSVHTVSPHLVCSDAAAAIEFYKQAFGATEMMRLPTPDGKILHACVSIFGSSVMLVDESIGCGMSSPQTLGGTPVTIHLMVDDVDAVVARAEQAGARIVMPVADMFWGDRYGVIADPGGHHWSIATHQRDLTPAEMQEAMLGFICKPAEA